MKADQRDRSGLSGAEAAARLRRHGSNELASAPRRTLDRIVLELAREPMFLLLLGAGAIYLVLGERSDALMLLGFVFIVMAITVFQERRTERVLETLRELSSPRALVIRDGERQRVPGRDVVQGDLLVLEEGDRVPADGVLLEGHDLLLDESLLTGESVAVAKPGGAGEDARIYSGTLVVRGGGLARVTAIGAATELGRIGGSLQELEPERSPLQREIGLLVKRFSLIGAAISLLVVVLYGIMRGDWFNGLLAGITLAMSLLPEEFTVILTVFMALGAWRISRNGVLTRRLPVIEALGSATVLCVDKTGTLTQNRMSVRALLYAGGSDWLDPDEPGPLPPAAHALLAHASLASEVDPFDAMDKAFHRSLATRDPVQAERQRGWSLVHEYPLTAELQAMVHVWKDDQGEYLVAAKGAPEAIAGLCRLDETQAEAMHVQARQLAAQGMRVLAVAAVRHVRPAAAGWPHGAGALAIRWVGLVGLADPLRQGVAGAVRECRQAGIRVVMITGDYPATAQAIAREAGLPAARVVSGAEIGAADDAALRQIVRDVHVFARVRPEQKLRLVNALQRAGEIVAMTGDGVNDAPALKAAHIGISMGERGTDVAREASSLVLLRDDFSAIVQAVALGRRIYDNLRKALTYVIAAHLPIIGMALLPLLAGAPLALMPVHIVFLEMIINPACSIVFEAEPADPGSMRRPPRSVTEQLLSASRLAFALLQGCGLLAAVALVFFFALKQGALPEQARAASFSSVVLGNLVLIVAIRSRRLGLLRLLRIANPAQWWMLGGALAGLAAVLLLPPLQRAFHFAEPRTAELPLVALALAFTIAWSELVKLPFRHGAAARARDA